MSSIVTSPFLLSATKNASLDSYSRQVFQFRLEQRTVVGEGKGLTLRDDSGFSRCTLANILRSSVSKALSSAP